ncbi:MAG: 4-hydroxy-3-methylbut-2-enyl diphosphate reductase [Endomicrobium sp.]|jgi:4-hydroxy-3-methylbut-2-enyl diphosphate reductase|nr:4-hydroxy-3-methylbut-2-enyl diphosphate reductase [Endomicrobium sp.]
MTKIKVADKSGFCFGVKRAIGIAENAVNADKKTYTLGPIIHNPQEVDRLEKEGIKTLKDAKKVKNATIILRTHGIPLFLHKELLGKKDVEIIDATCPFVKRAQNIVTELASKGETIIIAGEKKHPEVVALVSYGGDKCFVIENFFEAEKFNGQSSYINIVSQTTQTPKNFSDIVKSLKKRYKVKVYNTICKATFDRQNAAQKLAAKVDLMIVIGGKNSGNTTRLAQICAQKTKTRHIETVSEIKPEWFKETLSQGSLPQKKIGLTAGASTPGWIIKQVKEEIKRQLTASAGLRRASKTGNKSAAAGIRTNKNKVQ